MHAAGCTAGGVAAWREAGLVLGQYEYEGFPSGGRIPLVLCRVLVTGRGRARGEGKGEAVEEASTAGGCSVPVMHL